MHVGRVISKDIATKLFLNNRCPAFSLLGNAFHVRFARPRFERVAIE